MNVATAVASLREWVDNLDPHDGFGLPAYVDSVDSIAPFLSWSFVTLPTEYSSYYSNYYVEALDMHPHMYTEDVWCVLLGADGSAQLLSRDEEECRLFATLWELSK